MDKRWKDKERIEAIIINGLVDHGFVDTANIDSVDSVDVNVSKDISYGSNADCQRGTDIEDAAYMAAYGSAMVVWKYCPWEKDDILLF